MNHKKNQRRLRLNYEHLDDIQISVASTYEELVAAHTLCYGVYLEEGYTAKNQQKIRLSLHHTLPTTTTFIASYKGHVIGTLMAIADGPLGLPSDKFYDLRALKKQYGRLVEGSGYAIDKNYRGSSGSIFFLLYKYFFKFVGEYLAADCVIASINPKQKSFYNKILLFEECNNDIVPADTANGAPAVLLNLDLNTYKDKYLISYGNLEKAHNLYQYMFDYECSNFVFPERKLFLAGYPTVSPSIFSRVINEQWSLFEYLSAEDLQTLRDIYAFDEYDRAFIASSLQEGLKPRRQCRFSSRAFLKSINGIDLQQKLLVKDVSISGLLVKLNSNTLVTQQPPRWVVIEIANKEFNLEIKPIWQKHTHVGYQIINPPLHWRQLILKGEDQIIKEPVISAKAS